MKKILLIAIAIFSVSYLHAQTKGTSTLELGVTAQTVKYGLNDETIVKNNNYSIGYGNFIKENTLLEFGLSYSNSKQTDQGASTTGNGYGANISYQKYYPLFSKFYAFAGGGVRYNYFKQKSDGSDTNHTITNAGSAGINGGLTYFASKHFAFETSLLGANIVYSKSNGTNTSNSDYTSFNLSTSGTFNNLGFKIYFLF